MKSLRSSRKQLWVECEAQICRIGDRKACIHHHKLFLDLSWICSRVSSNLLTVGTRHCRKCLPTFFGSATLRKHNSSCLLAVADRTLTRRALFSSPGPTSFLPRNALNDYSLPLSLGCTWPGSWITRHQYHRILLCLPIFTPLWGLLFLGSLLVQCMYSYIYLLYS